METNKTVTCPHCGGDRCYTESHTVEETSVSSYMCMDCGYTTTTLNVEESEMLKAYEEVTPQLIIDLRWVDPQTNLVWYPTVLNFPSTGIVFADGTSTQNWGWTAAPAVDIPKKEQSKYPVPGQNGKFYEKKIDMEQSKKFAPDEFYEACKSLGLVEEV
jgi:hypothetical protein